MSNDRDTLHKHEAWTVTRMSVLFAAVDHLLSAHVEANPDDTTAENLLDQLRGLM